MGGDRFRLLDVVVGEDPPYLQAEVEWLADEEMAEEAAGDDDGLVAPPGLVVPALPGGAVDDVAAAVARGSMGVLSRNVRDLFARYVAEVAASAPAADGPRWTRETRGAAPRRRRRPRGALLPRGVGRAAHARGPAGAAGGSATRRRLAAESRLLRRELTLLQTLGAVPVPLQQFATPMTVN